MPYRTHRQDIQRSKLITPKDAAELLGVTTETLRRWAREGILHPIRTPGGRFRYYEDEVLRLLEEGRMWRR